MWPTFVWDLNITTLAVFVSGLAAFYLAVMRQRDLLRDLKSIVERHGHAMGALKAEHEMLKDKVIGEYVRRREDFDPVIDKLFDKIDEQGKRQLEAIDRIYDRLLDDAAARPPPGRRG